METFPAVFTVVVAGLAAVVLFGMCKAIGDALHAHKKIKDDVKFNRAMEEFLKQMADEKPVRFTPQQLSELTRRYSERLGAGGFGTVYKGVLPNGLAVAVKVLHGGLGRRRSEEQFMAEVGTIGRTHHINLVKLFGFCFGDGDDAGVRALVYEYMEHGSLDGYLFDRTSHGGAAGFPALRAIAVGVARGLRYLHEECPQRQKIVHYDIKPGNVLLDGDLTPKLADFGLARLVDRADTHVSVSGFRGTPGYAAPEMYWMQSGGVTEKCDVYSFGILLFEIVGRRKNFDDTVPESQQWFPKLAWTKYESGELMELMMPPGRDDHDGVAEADELLCRELAERMCKVAFWCVQQHPRARPPMGNVVKMLDGEVDIPAPLNPFQHLMAPEPAATELWTTMTSSLNTVSASLANDISRGSNEIVSV